MTALFCSIIIPTIGRPSLNRAVDTVLATIGSANDCELIVVNDSGQPLAPAAWQQSNKVRIIATNRRNRSVARNCGAAIARSHYFHFLDDDDWLEPDALAAWRELAARNEAAWLYGGFRLVDNSGASLAEIQPVLAGDCFLQVMASEWIPLQASLIEAHAFFTVGGFAPLPSLLGGYEDIDLLRLIAHQYTLASTNKIVANIRSGDHSSTTDYANMINQNRQSREKLLAATGMLARLHQAAASDKDKAYWYGRIAYYYLASTRWNLRRHRFFTATSRALHALFTVLTGPHFLSRQFWQALVKPHHNQVRQVVEQRGLALYQDTDWID